MNRYQVTVSNYFDAESPEDAVLQTAAWLDDYAYEVGYRVDEFNEDGSLRDSTFIDAEGLDMGLHLDVDDAFAVTYKITRFYADDRPSRVVDWNLTLEEAQAHCQREDTHGDDWFDGYDIDEQERLR